MGVVEEDDHSLSVRGVEDSHKLIGDFWNMVNNRQKVSVNILTNNMVYEQEVEGKQIVVYPTVAGLLMFGHEYDITREMPDYFLDYREQLDPKIRWTHRIVSSSGDWSGNLFDFFFHVYHRLRSAFPVPFQLSQDGSREDDVPMHKALREMIVNAILCKHLHKRAYVKSCIM